MNFFIEYWWVLVIVVAIGGTTGWAIYTFTKKPLSEQIDNVKEWLLYAVTEAEKELGSGTGQIKLRYVYDMFLVTFPALARLISFEQFSFLVDEALDTFRPLLEQNKSLKSYVEGE